MKPEEILKQRDILHQISQASDAIRKKHRMLKLGKDTADKAMDEMFKPIVTPLKTLVEASKQNVKTEDPKKEETLADETELSAYNSLVTEDESSAAFDQTQLSIAPESSSTPARPKSLAKQYLAKLSNNPGNMDTRYGVRKIKKGHYMGDSPISFKNNMVKVKEREYPLTNGLLELLFQKDPNDELVTQDDKMKYLDIVKRTNTHRKSFNPDNSIYMDSTAKFKNYIVDFINQSGRGLPKFMVARKQRRPMDYVYWDDPNELVDRLRLLMASQAAGNPSHTNEIMSIIEELREAEVIF